MGLKPYPKRVKHKDALSAVAKVCATLAPTARACLHPLLVWQGSGRVI